MKKLIIANWKMNPGSQRDASRLAHFVGRGLRKAKNVEIVLAPPFVYLPLLSNLRRRIYSGKREGLTLEKFLRYSLKRPA